MGRTGLLAIAVVFALASSVFAEPPRPCTQVLPVAAEVGGPAVPDDVAVELDADIELDVERYTSVIAVTGSFDHAARVTLIDMSGHSQPTATVIVAPNRGACELAVGYDGSVLVSVEAIDAAGHVGPPHFTTATGTPWQSMPGLDVASAFRWLLIALVAIMSLVAMLRRIHRGTNGEVPLVISRVLAEELARHARTRDGIFALALAAGGIAVLPVYGHWVALGALWFMLRLGDYWVATRAVNLLERPRALAELYGTNLVVRADDHTSAVSLSRIEIKRAQRRALPRAAIQ